MKKLISAILVTCMLLSFASCKKSDDNKSSKDNKKSKTEESDKKDDEKEDETKPASEDDSNIDSDDVGYVAESEYIVFNVSQDFEIDSDAWLGVIPTGKIYTKEIDADDVDIVYTYCENFDMDGATSYRFAFEKNYLLSIDDGTYDMVLCSSDNGDVGKVLIQIGLEKSGDKITLDYANLK